MMSYSNWEWLYQDGVPVLYAEYRGIPVAFTWVDQYIAYITHGNEILGPFCNYNLNLLQLNVRLHIDQDVLSEGQTWAEMGKRWLNDYLDALTHFPRLGERKPSLTEWADRLQPYPVPDWWLSDGLDSKTPWKISTSDTPRRPRNVDEFLASLGLK